MPSSRLHLLLPMRHTRPSPSCSFRRNTCHVSARCWEHVAGDRPEEPDIWVAHQAVIEGEVVGPLEFETDRARFLGRGHEIGAPIALMDGRRLSNTVGTVLDPVLALRCRVRVPAGATVRVAYWTAVADSTTGRARPARQAPRPECVRARKHTRVDPGAGATAPPGHHGGGRRPVPAPGGARALCGRVHAAIVRLDPSRRGCSVSPLEPGHLRRSADRAAENRQCRRRRHRAAVAAGP